MRGLGSVLYVTAVTGQWQWDWGHGEAQLQGPEITNYSLFHSTVSLYSEASLHGTPFPYQRGGLAFCFVLILVNSMYAPPSLLVDKGLGKCLYSNIINDTNIK